MRVIDANELYRVKFHGYPDIEITPSDVNAEAYKRGWNDAIDAVAECAPVVEVVRCKDCKHYLRNKIYVIDGLPLMGNQVCEKWGDGCRTDENGFCFMGERRKINETD